MPRQCYVPTKPAPDDLRQRVQPDLPVRGPIIAAQVAEVAEAAKRARAAAELLE